MGEGWTFALELAELWDGEMTGVRVADRDVLLVNVGGVVHAYEDRCPHASAKLSEGELSATTLRCGSHHWEFDVASGAGINPRNCRLRTFEVQVVDGAVFVRL
jgi:toluene monooxygenase system ferredoxin subunit